MRKTHNIRGLYNNIIAIASPMTPTHILLKMLVSLNYTIPGEYQSTTNLGYLENDFAEGRNGPISMLKHPAKALSSPGNNKIIIVYNSYLENNFLIRERQFKSEKLSYYNQSVRDRKSVIKNTRQFSQFSIGIILLLKFN